MSGLRDFLKATRALRWRELAGSCVLGLLIGGALLAVVKSGEAWVSWRSDVKCSVVALDARTKALDARIKRLERIHELGHEIGKLREILDETGP